MANVPRHVAIVMDGNGRWAKQRNMLRAVGHRMGVKAVHKAVDFAVKKNIEVLTLFALSVENKKLRPITEVNFLMTLFLETLEKNLAELHKNNVRIRIIGERSEFDARLLELISAAEELTQCNMGMMLNVAINYSGRWDIVQAVRQIADKVLQHSLTLSEIDEERVQQFLCLHDLPEPDLLIRTGGEQRVSNFLLWQFAYTEMFFSKVLWPDFNEDIFQEALTFFQTRNRRFGAANEAVIFGEYPESRQ